MLKANGRKCIQLFAVANGHQRFHQDNDPFRAISLQQSFQQVGHQLPGLSGDLETASCFFQHCFDIDVFREVQELLTPEVLTKVRHTDIGLYTGILFKIQVIKTPVMRQVGAYHYNVARFESFDAVANELGAFSFFKMDELYFGMIVPAVVDIRHQVAAYAE